MECSEALRLQGAWIRLINSQSELEQIRTPGCTRRVNYASAIPPNSCTCGLSDMLTAYSGGFPPELVTVVTLSYPPALTAGLTYLTAAALAFSAFSNRFVGRCRLSRGVIAPHRSCGFCLILNSDSVYDDILEVDLMDTFTERVFETIRDEMLVEEGNTVVAAVSGGPDSVALLSVLIELRDPLKIDLRAAHVNHGLRGADSEADEQLVRDLCRNWSIRLNVDCLRPEQSRGHNLEAEARRLRYDFLASLAEESSDVIATGHTMNDQSETFLMKLFRGASTTGLSGIFISRWHRLSSGRLVPVVRPLLRLSRLETLEYLKRRRLPYREDRSNRELSFSRNWVRHVLIPSIEDRLNPKLNDVLNRTAALFAEIDSFLEDEIRTRLLEIATQEAEAWCLEIKPFRNLPHLLQKQAVKVILRRTRGDLENLTQRHIEQVLRLCELQSGRRVVLPGGLEVSREFEKLRFSRRRQTKRFKYELQVPGELFIAEVGKRLVIRRVDSEASEESGLIRLEGKVIVRNRRDGDRYRVSPRSSEKKLKKVLLERRIPIGDRESLVVIEAREKIIWVEGIPPNTVYSGRESASDLFKVEIIVETF